MHVISHWVLLDSGEVEYEAQYNIDSYLCLINALNVNSRTLELSYDAAMTLAVL